MTETDFWKETWKAFAGILLAGAFLGSIYSFFVLLNSSRLTDEKVLMRLESYGYAACAITIPVLFLLYILTTAHSDRVREQSRTYRKENRIARIDAAKNRRIKKTTRTSWKLE